MPGMLSAHPAGKRQALPSSSAGRTRLLRQVARFGRSVSGVAFMGYHCACRLPRVIATATKSANRIACSLNVTCTTQDGQIVPAAVNIRASVDGVHRAIEVPMPILLQEERDGVQLLTLNRPVPVQVVVPC